MLKERQALWLGEAWALRDFYYQQSRKRQQLQDLLLAYSSKCQIIPWLRSLPFNIVTS